MSRKYKGLSYRACQSYNKFEFSKLNQLQQQALRKKGYRNIGWDSVILSWELLTELIELADIHEKKTQVIDFAKRKFEIVKHRYEEIKVDSTPAEDKSIAQLADEGKIINQYVHAIVESF